MASSAAARPAAGACITPCPPKPGAVDRSPGRRGPRRRSRDGRASPGTSPAQHRAGSTGRSARNGNRFGDAFGELLEEPRVDRGVAAGRVRGVRVGDDPAATHLAPCEDAGVEVDDHRRERRRHVVEHRQVAADRLDGERRPAGERRHRPGVGAGGVHDDVGSMHLLADGQRPRRPVAVEADRTGARVRSATPAFARLASERGRGARRVEEAVARMERRGPQTLEPQPRRHLGRLRRRQDRVATPCERWSSAARSSPAAPSSVPASRRYPVWWNATSGCVAARVS